MPTTHETDDDYGRSVSLASEVARAHGLFVSLVGIEVNNQYADPPWSRINVERCADRIREIAEAETGRSVEVAVDPDDANVLERGQHRTDISRWFDAQIGDVVCDYDMWDDRSPVDDLRDRFPNADTLHGHDHSIVIGWKDGIICVTHDGANDWTVALYTADAWTTHGQDHEECVWTGVEDDDGEVVEIVERVTDDHPEGTTWVDWAQQVILDHHDGMRGGV